MLQFFRKVALNRVRVVTTRCNRTVATEFTSQASKIKFSSGRLGHLAAGSVLCSDGGTIVHAAVCRGFDGDIKDGSLPLTVEYRSRAYAFGAIPSSSNRRERHGSDDEVLVARFIDRAIRPLFHQGCTRDIHVTVTNHASDGINDPTVAAVNAASFALLKSKSLWGGPIGCVRVGLIDGRLKLNPSVSEMEMSELDFLYAGTLSRPLMIETIAKEVSEKVLNQAMALAHSGAIEIIKAQQKLLQNLDDKEPGFSTDQMPQNRTSPENLTLAVKDNISEILKVPLELAAAAEDIGLEAAKAVFREGLTAKAERGRSEGAVRTKILEELRADTVWANEKPLVLSTAADGVMEKAFRDVVLSGRRVDGRGLTEVRPVECAADVMPGVHGSALFARGDTQVLCTTTLGSQSDAKETLLPVSGGDQHKQLFFLHYDFPPYCTGVVGNASAVNRRMLGHGNLAERAIRGLIPNFSDFPYAIRVYSECTSSSGSSSMASVCGASLSLMDAGVPIRAPAAGVSIGLVTAPDFDTACEEEERLIEAGLHNVFGGRPSGTHGGLWNESGFLPAVKGKFVLLTDILGTEDHYGDMDFKIAGTARGVTSMQLDVKLSKGVPAAVLSEAMHQAKDARRHILACMKAQALAEPRASTKASAPRAEVVRFDPERKRHLLGPGGEMLRFIEDTYSCKVDLTEEGVAYIFGHNERDVLRARSLVEDLVILVKEGDRLSAEVLDVKDFGAMVKITRAQEALLHVSELSHDAALIRRPLVELLVVGQRLEVKVLSVDKATGQVRVSRKQLLQKDGGPDLLRAQPPSEEQERIESLPSFPVVPPRKWSPDFFRNSVASEEDIEKVVKSRSKANAPGAGAQPPPPENEMGGADIAPLEGFGDILPRQHARGGNRRERSRRSAEKEDFSRSDGSSYSGRNKDASGQQMRSGREPLMPSMPPAKWIPKSQRHQQEQEDLKERLVPRTGGQGLQGSLAKAELATSLSKSSRKENRNMNGKLGGSGGASRGGGQARVGVMPVGIDSLVGDLFSLLDATSAAPKDSGESIATKQVADPESTTEESDQSGSRDGDTTGPSSAVESDGAEQVLSDTDYVTTRANIEKDSGVVNDVALAGDGVGEAAALAEAVAPGKGFSTPESAVREVSKDSTKKRGSRGSGRGSRSSKDGNAVDDDSASSESKRAPKPRRLRKQQSDESSSASAEETMPAGEAARASRAAGKKKRDQPPNTPSPESRGEKTRTRRKSSKKGDPVVSGIFDDLLAVTLRGGAEAAGPVVDSQVVAVESEAQQVQQPSKAVIKIVRVGRRKQESESTVVAAAAASAGEHSTETSKSEKVEVVDDGDELVGDGYREVFSR